MHIQQILLQSNIDLIKHATFTSGCFIMQLGFMIGIYCLCTSCVFVSGVHIVAYFEWMRLFQILYERAKNCNQVLATCQFQSCNEGFCEEFMELPWDSLEIFINFNFIPYGLYVPWWRSSQWSVQNQEQQSHCWLLKSLSLLLHSMIQSDSANIISMTTDKKKWHPTNSEFTKHKFLE